MSDKGSSSPTVFICPLCRFKKTPVQHNLLCGDCVHQEIELVRNSVIENEDKNIAMREQIGLVFDKCVKLSAKCGKEGKGKSEKGEKFGNCGNKKDNEDADDTGLSDKGIILPSKLPGLSKSLLPSHYAVQELALHLQKLEITNRKAKIHGLQKTTNLLTKKNKVLKERLETASLRFKEKRSKIAEARVIMLEEYSRSLERADLEILSIRSDAMRHVRRQAVSIQYGNYKVMRDALFKNNQSHAQFCHRPVLEIVQFFDAEIIPLNTFLEDLIRLQMIIKDLFGSGEKSLELPYLEYLKKLIPESNFFDLVQSKINSLLPLETSESGEDEEGKSSALSQRSFSPNFGKVTIKNKKIHVPKSFRTMNLQRRSSVKSTDDLDARSQFILNDQGSTFVMVPQEQLIDKSLSETAEEKNIKEGIKPSSEDHKALAKVNTLSHPELNGKMIVVVPHRILTKPFSKLRPQEYSKFLSIVAQILVNFNEILRTILGPLPVGKGTLPPDCHFLYNFGDILGRITNLDEYFKNSLEQRTIMATNTQASGGNIDGSQLTNIIEGYRSIRDSWSESAIPMVSSFPQISKLKELYTKFISRSKNSGMRPSLSSSVSDDKVYGIVSETTEGDKQGSQMARNNVHVGHRIKTLSDREKNNMEYSMKKIQKKVHDLISGLPKCGEPGPTRLVKSGANSTLHQSQANFEEWDVVSKMFQREER